MANFGTGSLGTIKAPIYINLKDISKVKASGNTSFGITAKGELYAWGEGYGKVPKLIEKNKNVTDVTKTYYLSDDGIVRKIADDTEIKLSLNEYDPSEEPVLVQDRIVQISEGTDHLLALSASGRIYSYGTNTYGQLGDNGTVSRTKNITTIVRTADGTALENVSEVSAGDRYSVATTSDGKVYTWGINEFKTLGFENKIEEGGIHETWSALLKADISNVERVSAGYKHVAVYKEDGNVFTWGNGENRRTWEPAKTSITTYLSLFGKTLIQTNTAGLVLKKEDTFDIDAFVDYFNLFTETTAEISYEILDQNMAILDPVSR